MTHHPGQRTWRSLHPRPWLVGLITLALNACASLDSLGAPKEKRAPCSFSASAAGEPCGPEIPLHPRAQDWAGSSGGADSV